MTLSGSTFNPDSVSSGLPPFSWSLLRRKRFAYCRRAYFFHYYGAAGGWDAHAPDRLRLIYRLKQARHVDDWLTQLLADAAAEVFRLRRPQFRDNLPFFAARLRQTCSYRFHRGLDDLRQQRFRDDPKALSLVELSAPDARPEAVLADAGPRLTRYLQDFLHHPLAAELSDLDSARFRHFRRPAGFVLDGTEIWLAPVLVWQSADTLNLFHILSAEEASAPDDLPLASALDRAWAETEFHFPPAQIVSRYWSVTASAELVSPPPWSDDAMRAAVAASIAAMQEKVLADGSALEDDFPGQPSPTEAPCCRTCRFRPLCLP